MSRVVGWTLVVAACAGPPARTLHHDTAREPQRPAIHTATFKPRIATPRPTIDVANVLPDPAHELRWPRTSNSHPVLEPSYDIAGALAQPGVTWLDLCRLGAQNRQFSSGNQDQVTYLRAWCSVAKHDIDDAIYRLAPLRRSPVLGIPAAIPLDLANILVDTGSADDAELRLVKNHLPDPDILDMLAATYVEIGKLEDAAQINAKAIESNAFASPATQCRRLAKQVVLGAPAWLKQLDVYAADPKHADPICTQLAHELHCAVFPATDCHAYFIDEGIDPHTSFLFTAYFQWPEAAASAETWSSIADVALLALPVRHADLLAVTALESAARATPCTKGFKTELQVSARRLRGMPQHDTALDPRLSIVIDKPEQLCFRP